MKKIVKIDIVIDIEKSSINPLALIKISGRIPDYTKANKRLAKKIAQMQVAICFCHQITLEQGSDSCC